MRDAHQCRPTDGAALLPQTNPRGTGGVFVPSSLPQRLEIQKMLCPPLFPSVVVSAHQWFTKAKTDGKIIEGKIMGGRRSLGETA